MSLTYKNITHRETLMHWILQVKYTTKNAFSFVKPTNRVWAKQAADLSSQKDGFNSIKQDILEDTSKYMGGA